ncbi:MAG: chorion class high-cysteine HCB protein 13 [Herbinix sp.]|nr:chorion class high-cysteine HCB protein 13 [Herbinix sp.]
MSDLSCTSCCGSNKSDNGISPIFMILILLFLTGGDNGIFGSCNGNNTCGCNGGLDGILPIILLLFCGGGSIF